VAAAWLVVPEVVGVQIPFGVLDPEATDDLFPQLAGRPVDVWARGVLGGGLLARATRDPGAIVGDAKEPIIAALRDLQATTGLGLDELATAFVRSFPEVSTILIGIGSSEHLRRNVELLGEPPPDTGVVMQLQALARHEDAGARG
jgi:aryl-alcohol dehydrogenase-like predicted oxidoreductase